MNTNIKITKEFISNVLYRIYKYKSGKEEIHFTGYDMGNRIWVIKWLSENILIAKVPARKVLYGARGCGMVCPFVTVYYLIKIHEKLTDEIGKCSLVYRMECGKFWRKGISELTNYKNKL